ncbi:hypothetical protein ACQEU6_20825 [Spirillospora sp. CA-108201]
MVEDSDQGFTLVGSWHYRLGPGPAASSRLVKGLLSGQPDKAKKVERGVTALVTNVYRHCLGLTAEEIQRMETFPEDVVLRLACIRRGRSYHLRIEVYAPNPAPPDLARCLDDAPAANGRASAPIRDDLSRYGAVFAKDWNCVMVEYELDHPVS